MITAKITDLLNDAMAGNDETDGVTGHGISDRLSGLGLANIGSNIIVRYYRPSRNL